MRSRTDARNPRKEVDQMMEERDAVAEHKKRVEKMQAAIPDIVQAIKNNGLTVGQAIVALKKAKEEVIRNTKV